MNKEHFRGISPEEESKEIGQTEQTLGDNNISDLGKNVPIFKRVATTLMVGHELKTIFKAKAPRSTGSFSNYIEKLIVKDFQLKKWI